MDRWHERQMPILGEDGVTRIAKSEVVVVGLGGLGTHLAQTLFGLGVRRFRFFDGDLVAMNNLHRTPIFELRDVGRNKAEAAADFFKSRDELCVIKIGGNLDLESSLAFPGCFLVDCSDEWAVTQMLVNCECLGFFWAKCNTLDAMMGFNGPNAGERYREYMSRSSSQQSVPVPIITPVVALTASNLSLRMTEVLCKGMPSDHSEITILSLAKGISASTCLTLK